MKRMGSRGRPRLDIRRAEAQVWSEGGVVVFAAGEDGLVWSWTVRQAA